MKQRSDKQSSSLKTEEVDECFADSYHKRVALEVIKRALMDLSASQLEVAPWLRSQAFMWFDKPGNRDQVKTFAWWAMILGLEESSIIRLQKVAHALYFNKGVKGMGSVPFIIEQLINLERVENDRG